MKIIRQKICKYHMRDVMFINKCRKIFIKFGMYIVIFGIALLVALLPNVIKSEEHETYYETRHATDLKYILFWKESKKNKKNFFNRDVIYSEGQKSLIEQNCPYINCYLTYNKNLIRSKNFDAIVFNIHDIRKLKVNTINSLRSHHQKFIFKSLNSAASHPVCNKLLDNFFNLTWTYKLDSDIPHPFIKVVDSNNTIIGPRNNMTWIEKMESTNKYKDDIKIKTKAVAWFVPSCKLKNTHQEFLKDLKYELEGYNYTLDTFGKCGKWPCGNTERRSDSCYKKIEKDYYFQLVLEDSVTQDYVTETLANAMMQLSVPIVLGSNFSSFLPPGSYINAGTFEMKKLGAIIDYLIRNPDKYSYFFDWKRYYYFATKSRSSICDLCTKLNEHNKTQTYSEFRDWWRNDYAEICESIRLYNMFKTL